MENVLEMRRLKNDEFPELPVDTFRTMVA